MRHSHCNLCDNPYPYMCSECAEEDHGPAASRRTKPYVSMGEMYARTINKPQAKEAKKTFIGSGEDVECGL